MFRLILLFLGLALGACHHDPQPVKPKEGELPPLPPASGSAVGYLVDNATQLKLHDDQLEKLKAIDNSLTARNDSIDTQLRAMETPEEDPEPKKGQPPKRHNNAPGAETKTNADAQKLHNMRDANDQEALEKAFAVLDDDQKTIAKRILDDRGIAAPGTKKKGETHSEEDGKPLPGMEP